MGLHTPLYFVVVKVLAFVNERLPVLVVGSIVQVLRLESSGINHGETRVFAINDVMFDQLHNAAPFSQRVLLRACCQGQPLCLGKALALFAIGTYLCPVGTQRLSMGEVRTLHAARGPERGVQRQERQQETEMGY